MSLFRARLALLGLFVALPAIAFWLSPSHVARAQAAATPAHCRVGLYITSLSDFNLTANTFNADMWIWSVCVEQDRTPLKTMEFVNASRVLTSLDSTIIKENLYWSQQKVSATLRHHWDAPNYPFDQHTLEILLEEGIEDTSSFIYEPDLRNTNYNGQIDIDGWEIVGLTFKESPVTYNTTYGDPSLADGSSSQYSRLWLEIVIRRSEYTSFLNLTSAVYISIMIMFVTFFMHVDIVGTLGPRMSLLAGALFAVVISLRSISGSMGIGHGLTLIGQIHILALFYIFSATVITVLSRHRLDAGLPVAAMRRFNYRCFVVSAISYIVINVGLIVAVVLAS